MQASRETEDRGRFLFDKSLRREVRYLIHSRERGERENSLNKPEDRKALSSLVGECHRVILSKSMFMEKDHAAGYVNV